MKILDGGGVTSPRGFSASGVRAGIKPGSQKTDLALVYSEEVASGAAVFTTNRVQAAPIAIDREHLQNGRARAVLLNSGNANACTGAQGLADAWRMCRLTANALGLELEEVLVCSTGVIGVPLPMAAIEQGIPAAVAGLSNSGGELAAQAIMTTDTVPKSCAVELEIDGRTVRVGGMAKGAGMIAPHLATMLVVITTDAAVAPGMLQKLLERAVQRSFNCITIDGDMSTNDTVIALANGASGLPSFAPESSFAESFYAGLEEICRQLARLIARDGEGATKLVVVRVHGAHHENAARQVGLAVANSSLVKTALFGNDPNWGRILCAIGYSGVEFEVDQVSVSLCDTLIFANGAGQPFDKRQLSAAMKVDEVRIDIDLRQGTSVAEIFSCDFSYEYVRINAEYTT